MRPDPSNSRLLSQYKVPVMRPSITASVQITQELFRFAAARTVSVPRRSTGREALEEKLRFPSSMAAAQEGQIVVFAKTETECPTPQRKQCTRFAPGPLRCGCCPRGLLSAPMERWLLHDLQKVETAPAGSSWEAPQCGQATSIWFGLRKRPRAGSCGQVRRRVRRGLSGAEREPFRE